MAPARILIVEDDDALLEGLRDVLELSGFRVTTARNGVEGLAALNSGPLPDLIISDIMMPRMDGYQFYNQVRAHPEWVNVPFIFLTARGEKTDIRRGKLLGADDYLTKPFDEEDLIVAIRAKLSRRAQLEAAHRYEIADLKRTILTTLNHEFRTPLTYITTYTDILQNSGPDLTAEDFKDFMRGIQVGSERLRRLVEDFILLVELQTGEAQKTYERRREPIADLPALLGKVLTNSQARAAARNVELVAVLSETLPLVVADRDYLSNGVRRLIDNAIKFSKKEGGKVYLTTRSNDQRVSIQVRDEGVGIRTEELGKLFDMFHQIDRAKMEQQGSGSGLAIARSIAEMHGGSLSVESEYGVGSTFTVELPVAGPTQGLALPSAGGAVG